MISTYLFLPDNLMAILYEEQKLIQSLLDFPFKYPFPMFKSTQKFSKLIVHPPINRDGLIIRPCGEKFNTENFMEGFILGDAKTLGDLVIKKINGLQKMSKKIVFKELTCKSCYYLDIRFLQAEHCSACAWEIINKKWVKL